MSIRALKITGVVIALAFVFVGVVGAGVITSIPRNIDESEIVSNPTNCSEFAALVVANLQNVRVGGSTTTENGYRLSIKRDCLSYMKNLK